MNDLPKTRWETGETTGYIERFSKLIDDGADIVGEARLADAMVKRGSTILDAGAGFGRVGAELQRRGHTVVAAEKDESLVAVAAERYPDLPMVTTDLLALTPALLKDRDLPTSFDLIVLVGNVMVLLAPQTERQLLTGLRELLATDGRVLVGFHPVGGHGSSRNYPFDEFADDAAAVGLTVQCRFGTYELDPPSADYVVAILARA